jgi:hypothetical protein
MQLRGNKPCRSWKRDDGLMVIRTRAVVRLACAAARLLLALRANQAKSIVNKGSVELD